jgi:hypothetical protein
MKKFLLYFAFVFSLASEPIEVTTNISSVKLYENSAYIKREGKLNAKLPDNQFSISGLPVSLSDNSVIVSFSNQSKLKVKTVMIQEYTESGFQNEAAKKAQENYESIQRKLDILNNQYSIISDYKQIIQTLLPVKREPTLQSTSEITINTKIWNDYQNLIGGMMEENTKSQFILLRQIDDLNEELLVAEAKLDYYKNAEIIKRKRLVIEFNGYVSSQEKFSLEYIVKGAKWYPRYSVSIDPEKNTNQLSFYAIVKNNTGEDWNHISLEFSTAILSKKLKIPEITEYVVGYNVSRKRSSSFAKAASGTTNSAKKRASVFAETASARGLTAGSRGDKKEYDEKRKSYPKADIAPAAPTEQSKTLDDSFDEAEEDAVVADERNADGKELIIQSINSESSMNAQQHSFKTKSKAQEILKREQTQTNSVVTEQNLMQIKESYSKQVEFFQSNNYDEAIVYGKKAIEKFSRLSSKNRKELEFAEQKIESISRKSAMLKSNLRLGEGLIPLNALSIKGFDYRYKAKHKETILSDNSFNKVFIKDWKFPVKMAYEVSPISDKNVYVKCSSVQDGEEPLLRGPLDLFVFEDYLGTSTVDAAANLGNLKFNLGKDNDIKVERTEDMKMETTGFFSKTENQKFNVKYSIRNNKRNPVEITVIDRVPYTNNKSVTIKVHTKTKDMTVNDQGIINYKKNIPANKKSDFSILYDVSYPSGHVLYQTPREEEK